MKKAFFAHKRAKNATVLKKNVPLSKFLYYEGRLYPAFLTLKEKGIKEKGVLSNATLFPFLKH